MARVLALLLTLVSVLATSGGEPAFHFRTNDVIACVGGEDVVEMQRNGYLELLLTAALPHHQLRFRNLAFEGDTVFEQHRQLNFPSWEKQLERIGATVVVAQFGQAESLQGTNGLGKFVAAYEKLLERFTNGGRRLVLLAPTPVEKGSLAPAEFKARDRDLHRYSGAIYRWAQPRMQQFVDLSQAIAVAGASGQAFTRDGLHLNPAGHWLFATIITQALFAGGHGWSFDAAPAVLPKFTPAQEQLRQLILEKNRLWFDYWRPQNWAFLHGDRTEQQSSRDHRDPKKRWFPEEMEKFLSLIEAKEKEIWEAAAKLAKGE